MMDETQLPASHERYISFIEDLYDPEKMEIQFPAHGSVRTIRFSKKILHCDTASLEEILFGDKDIQDVIDVDIEIAEIDGVPVDVWEYRLLEEQVVRDTKTQEPIIDKKTGELKKTLL